jgi:phosphoglycolate phosphatase-like HAD superfamily hydrolase
MEKIKVLLWDFDGVIIDSNHAREYGFIEVLKGFPKGQIEDLINFHRKNGGLSRYVKFRHFFEVIRNEPLSDTDLQMLCDQFSEIVKSLLKDSSLLIPSTTSFIKSNYGKFKMHIVSGSDGNELVEICDYLGLSSYFLSIHGSPRPKIKLVEDLLKQNKYFNEECLLIGDSINDWEAASINNISFMGFNGSSDVMDKTNVVIDFIRNC